MKTWKLFVFVPVLALALPLLLAMRPQDQPVVQDPANADVSQIVRMSELQYVTAQGTTSIVPARNVLEIRLYEDAPGIRIELTYENGDYSLIDAQSFHLLRQGGNVQDVRLTRSRLGRMVFPKLR